MIEYGLPAAYEADAMNQAVKIEQSIAQTKVEVLVNWFSELGLLNPTATAR
jgi:hypothetical protein